MIFEDAAAVSLCGLTAAQGLFPRMGMAAPWDDGKAEEADSGDRDVRSVFMYGASTSVGMYGAQLARQSGLKIRLIGAASKARHAMLREQPYGYDDLVDYRDEDWPEQVRALCTGDGVHYAMDCISEGGMVEKVNSTLNSAGKQAILRSLEGGAWNQERPFDIQPIYGAVWEGLGEPVHYQGMIIPESAGARRFAVAFYKWLSCAAEDGNVRLVSNPVRSMPGGLEKVVKDGFVLLGTGNMEDRKHARTEPWMTPVRAEKLVYKLV